MRRGRNKKSEVFRGAPLVYQGVERPLEMFKKTKTGGK